MLEKYFSAPKTLARLRAGLSGPHIDGFADALEHDGYSPGSAVRYLRAAAHLGNFLQCNRGILADIDAERLDAFRRHVPRCRCPLSNGGKVNHHVFFGAKRFHAHLIQTGVCQSDPATRVQIIEPELIVSFRDWFRKHRGAAEPTLRQYCRVAAEMLEKLGGDLSQVRRARVVTTAKGAHLLRHTAATEIVQRQLLFPPVLPHSKMSPILNRLPQLNLTGC